MTVDVDLGGSAQIPLAPFDADALDIAPAEIAIYVKLPNATTLGPLAPSQADIDRRAYLFTTTQAGQHRYRVVETATDVQVTEGAFYAWPSYTDLTTLWAPSLTDVAGLVPTRTIDSAGTQQGTFTANTEPTATQVQGYISQIVAEIVGTVGTVPAALFEQAKGVAKLGVAWLVERSYTPTGDVQNLGTDFVNDYRASLRQLAASSRGVVSGSRAMSVSLGGYSWPEV